MMYRPGRCSAIASASAQPSRELMQTEEGLATLNTVMHEPNQCLVKVALSYYVCARASELNFNALYHDIAKYVADSGARFDWCAAAKRGYTDTAAPGGNGFLQTYFEGCCKILQSVEDIDLKFLFAGKLALEDADKVRRTLRRDGVHLPSFARNLRDYRAKLRRIGEENFILPRSGKHKLPSI